MDVWQGSKYAFGGLYTDVPREELAIAPVAEWLTTTGRQNYHQQISSKQHRGQFVDVFLIEEYEYAALWKEPLIAHLKDCFKTNNLGKS